MKIRNVAIIAHVDHGKTTIVDGLLKQSKTFRDNEFAMSQDLIMDSNDQERERGITILSKNTSVNYKGVKINIIDTPGHVDFGGEVERILNTADGALLVVDAQEGPMPQTKFVLKKALDLNLKIIVIVNKIDKTNAIISKTISKIYDLFLELASHEDQLVFPILYASGKLGKAWLKLPSDCSNNSDFEPIFDSIIKTIPEPHIDVDGPFQMLVSALDWDNHKGKYAIGRIRRGSVRSGDKLTVVKGEESVLKETVDKVYVTQGLKREETVQGFSGDIVSITGIKSAEIGDTITDPDKLEALYTIKIEEPTLSITIGANTSPLMGTEGKFVTSRQILARIEKELQTNVAMKLNINKEGKYMLLGRGELHLSVFLETLRREGFEVEVSKPTVVSKVVNGIQMEPVEELTVDVDKEYIGITKSEIGKRKGILIKQEDISDNSTRLIFEITTGAILGLRGVLLTLTKGTAEVSSIFIRNEKLDTRIQKTRKGVLISSHSGKAVSYGLVSAHNKGPVFVFPQTVVYEGMIVGINGRDEDLEINVCKEKQLTNNRSAGEEGVILPPPMEMSLEQQLSFLEDGELLEITPINLRLRKKILNSTLRRRSNKH